MSPASRDTNFDLICIPWKTRRAHDAAAGELPFPFSSWPLGFVGEVASQHNCSRPYTKLLDASGRICNALQHVSLRNKSRIASNGRMSDMTAFQEVVLLIWIDINVLFVLWRIFRATAQGEICIASVEPN